MAAKRSILITGGTANLGYYAALNIARQKPDTQIIIASRSDKDNAAKSINETLQQTNVSFMQLDLADLSNVRSFAKTWEDRALPPIEILLLNAGLQFPAEIHTTVDGFESTFAINHLGHGLLFHLLLPHLAPDVRIVLTSSGTHDPAQKSGLPDAIYDDAATLAHPTAETAKYAGRQRYATSKLCNVLWTYALNRRLQTAGKHMTVVAFDPGLMPGTGLAREATSSEQFLWNVVLPRVIPLLRWLVHPNIHRVQDSGATLAWIALDPEERKASGVYYEMRKHIKSSVDSYDEAKQDDLWNWTMETIAGEKEYQKFISATE